MASLQLDKAKETGFEAKCFTWRCFIFYYPFLQDLSTLGCENKRHIKITTKHSLCILFSVDVINNMISKRGQQCQEKFVLRRFKELNIYSAIPNIAIYTKMQPRKN